MKLKCTVSALVAGAMALLFPFGLTPNAVLAANEMVVDENITNWCSALATVGSPREGTGY